MPHSLVERWQTDPFVELSDDDPLSVRRPDTDKRTGLCPFGHGILLRARVDDNSTYYLERCGACRGVWLDRGEWQKLAASLYLDHLDDLWDPTWQKRRRTETLQHNLDNALAERLGQSLYGELCAVVDQLRHHPGKAQALAWITAHLDPDTQ
jgi:Zn-finger nucleic acid-binding protein